MIRVDMGKAKAIAHTIRREERAKEFAPLDDQIAKQIPGWEQAEAQRQVIRDKYSAIQDAIEAAGDVPALNGAMAQM